MTEQDKNPHPLTKIESVTHDDIKDFIFERVTNHTCPCCGTNNWNFLGDDEYLLALLALKKHSAAFSWPPPSIPQAVVCCSNCGFIRTHALGIIAAWKEGKRG